MGSIPSNPRWPGAGRGVVGADTISLTKHWNSFCRYSSRAFSGREEVDTCEGRAFFPEAPSSQEHRDVPFGSVVGSLRLPRTSGGTVGCVCGRCDPWAGGYSPEGDLLALLSMVAPSSQFLLNL